MNDESCALILHDQCISSDLLFYLVNSISQALFWMKSKAKKGWSPVSILLSASALAIATLCLGQA
jgi:hypothetical protein